MIDKETQTMMLVPQGSLETYIRAANEYPMLTAEEEKWNSGKRCLRPSSRTAPRART